jgi:hypothetical protein
MGCLTIPICTPLLRWYMKADDEAEGISDNFQPRHLLLEHHEGVAEGISVPIHGRPAGCKL